MRKRADWSFLRVCYIALWAAVWKGLHMAQRKHVFAPPSPIVSFCVTGKCYIVSQKLAKCREKRTQSLLAILGKQHHKNQTRSESKFWKSINQGLVSNILQSTFKKIKTCFTVGLFWKSGKPCEILFGVCQDVYWSLCKCGKGYSGAMRVEVTFLAWV